MEWNPLEALILVLHVYFYFYFFYKSNLVVWMDSGLVLVDQV